MNFNGIIGFFEENIPTVAGAFIENYISTAIEKAVANFGFKLKDWELKLVEAVVIALVYDYIHDPTIKEVLEGAFIVCVAEAGRILAGGL